MTSEQRGVMAHGLAGCALALALFRTAWVFHTLPGEAYCERDGRRLERFHLAIQLRADKAAQEK